MEALFCHYPFALHSLLHIHIGLLAVFSPISTILYVFFSFLSLKIQALKFCVLSLSLCGTVKCRFVMEGRRREFEETPN